MGTWKTWADGPTSGVLRSLAVIGLVAASTTACSAGREPTVVPPASATPAPSTNQAAGAIAPSTVVPSPATTLTPPAGQPSATPAPTGQPPTGPSITVKATPPPGAPGASAPERPAPPTSAAGPQVQASLIPSGLIGSYVNNDGGLEITGAGTGRVSVRVGAARPEARFRVERVEGQVATATIVDLTAPDPTGALAAGRQLTLRKAGVGVKVDQLASAPGGGLYCDALGEGSCGP